MDSQKERHEAKEFKCELCHGIFQDGGTKSHEEKLQDMKQNYGVTTQDVALLCSSCHQIVSRWWKQLQS